MAAKPLPPLELLRQLLDYDPETGALIWRARPLDGFVSEHMGKCWNTRYAGTMAGSKYAHGYVHIMINNERFLAHRIAWAIYSGTDPAHHVDHINGNRSDNRIANLRDKATHTTNARNSKRSTRNTSGVTGVSWRKANQKWMAYIQNNGQRCLGYFVNFEEAVAARKAAERALGFHPNHGRDMEIKALCKSQ